MYSETKKNENEQKKIIKNLLIQCNISILISIFFYTSLILIIYFSIDYFNILNHSIFELIKLSYLKTNLRSNLNKINNYYSKNHNNDILINIIGIDNNDHEILNKLVSLNNNYSRNIILENQDSDNDNINIFIKTDIKTFYHKIDNLKEISFENFPNIVDSLQIEDNYLTYSIFVSFQNCYKSNNKNLINLYKNRYSLFCISDINRNEFFIMVNDIINIWFKQFLEKKIILSNYISMNIYINHIIDYKVKNITDINNNLMYLFFNDFLNQINQLLDLKLFHQNKYINGSDIEINDPNRIYYIIKHNINSNYNNIDSNIFNLNFINYISYLNKSFFDINENTRFKRIYNNTDIYFYSNNFLFTYTNISDIDSYNKVISTWIQFIRNILLPEDHLNYKSKSNNVIIKNYIEDIYLNVFLTDWQISAFKLINNKYILNRGLSNIDKFIKSLDFYNIYKLEKYIIYSIDYINELIKNLKTLEPSYSSFLLKDSHDLLFNGDIHNSKSFDNDLTLSMYSPIVVPLIFIIIMTLFRLIKYSKKQFD